MMADSLIQILNIVSRDSRTPVETIAKLIDCPVEDVRAAVKQLEDDGIIKKYITVIDWDKAGLEKVVALIDVQVRPARDVGFDAVAERISRFPEVQSVFLVSGGSDLRIIVQGPNIRELGRFVSEKLATIDGVVGTETHFLLKRYKEDGVLFIDTEEDQRLVVSP